MNTSGRGGLVSVNPHGFERIREDLAAGIVARKDVAAGFARNKRLALSRKQNEKLARFGGEGRSTEASWYLKKRTFKPFHLFAK